MTSTSDDTPFDDDEPLPETELDDRLRLVARFARAAAVAPYFSQVGEPLGKDDLRLAEEYCEALGFPGIAVVPVAEFAEAAEAAEALGFDPMAWETSEILRAGLTARAADIAGAEMVEQALQDVAAYLGLALQDAVMDLGKSFDLVDEEFLNAAAGAALRACNNAALVLLAGEGDTHALALEYRLFEIGRWPVAVTGRTFHLF